MKKQLFNYYYNNGQKAQQAKKYAEAVEDYKAALEINPEPEKAAIFFKMGISYGALGKKAEQNEALKKYRTLDAAAAANDDILLTTAQNAIFSLQILARLYPQVRQLAIISSDYHIATGTLLFEAEAILRAEKAGEEQFSVVSNAAWHAPSGSLSGSFQAGALLELSGDTETAFEIYYDTYDIHVLPPLHGEG